MGGATSWTVMVKVRERVRMRSEAAAVTDTMRDPSAVMGCVNVPVEELMPAPARTRPPRHGPRQAECQCLSGIGVGGAGREAEQAELIHRHVGNGGQDRRFVPQGIADVAVDPGTPAEGPRKERIG